jgi:hypothetical protein
MRPFLNKNVKQLRGFSFHLAAHFDCAVLAVRADFADQAKESDLGRRHAAYTSLQV